MSSATGYIYLFTKMVRDKIAGITASYVDIMVSVGGEVFDRERRFTERMFNSSARIFDDVKLAGIEFRKEKNGAYIMPHTR